MEKSRVSQVNKDLQNKIANRQVIDKVFQAQKLSKLLNKVCQV